MAKKNQSPKVRMKREHAKAGKDLKFELKVKVLYKELAKYMCGANISGGYQWQLMFFNV